MRSVLLLMGASNEVGSSKASSSEANSSGEAGAAVWWG